MDDNELIQQARKCAVCMIGADECRIESRKIDNCADVIDLLADALEAAQKELIDYHHTQKTVDGKMSENARLRRIIDKLTARSEKAEAENRWIPVGERLPDKVGRYLTTHISTTYKGNKPQNKVSELDWAGDECGWLINGLHQVTHWRPLPEPPKGE